MAVPDDSPRRHFEGHTRFLGTITPSGNTVVERITLGILRHFPQVSAHFSRTSVFGSTDPFPDSYDFADMLRAAELLSHASLEVIAWNGSKGGSIDFALDHELCKRIVDATGAKTCTSTLAIDEAFRARGVKTFALVSPYKGAYQDRIIGTFTRAGYRCVAEAHAGLADNLSFARMPLDRIADMIRSVAAPAAGSRPDAIVTYCTNFPAAPLAAGIEAEFGIPMFDSVAMAVWKSLRLMDIDTSPARAWGRVFAES